MTRAIAEHSRTIRLPVHIVEALNRISRFETYEYLHLGIAVNSTTILGLKLSSGLAIRDHALRHGAQLR